MTNDPYHNPTLTSPPPPPPTGSADELQFDRAESATPPSPAAVAGFQPAPAAMASACAVCARRLTDWYFEAGGKILCPQCQQMVAASYSGGSGFLRFVKASVFGVVTAAAAAAAWIAITVAREGRISGIVAIGVAFLIGGAVRLGSGRRGGIAYQLLAMFITYLAIAATLTVYELRAPDGPKVESGAGWGLLVAFGLTVGPIIEGVSSPILGFIIAISLWEAWRLNRKQRITFNGPYRVGAPAGAAANAAQPYPTPPMYPPPPPGAWPPPTGGA